MNGGLKRKQPEGSQKAADAIEPECSPGGEPKQPPEQPAGQEQEPGGQSEQPKRQKQQDGAMEGAKQGVDSQRQTQAVVQQGSGLAAPGQLQGNVGVKGPARQQLEQRQLPGQRLAEDRREIATRRAAQQPLPAARQHRWPVPPPRMNPQQQRQHEWRPAQGPQAHLQPQLQPPMASWQPAAQPWQAPPGGPGWQQPQVWGPQQAQLGALWDAPLGQAPTWDPALQQWPAAHTLQAHHWPAPAAPLAATAATTADPWQQAPAPPPPPAPMVHASAAPPVQPLVQQQALALQQQQQELVHQQALVLQQQQLVQQQAFALQQQAQQAQHQAAPRQPQSKLERDLPVGGQGEALLRLAVRICSERLGPGEHDGGQLGKVLEELDRNWRRGLCGGYSVSVLLKELDRRGLVVAREETSSGKRVCIFRNLAC